MDTSRAPSADVLRSEVLQCSARRAYLAEGKLAVILVVA
jgi:hypothetical protein